MSDAPEIPGADEVVRWFGYWPTFHDAEVVSITLDRLRGCQVVIRCQASAREALVTFSLEGFPLDEEGISNIRIEGFQHQNVLSSAVVEREAGGYVLTLDGIFGVAGAIPCERISVKLDVVT